MTDWHPESDEILALALGELGPEEQEALTAHVAGCTSCHAEYVSLSSDIEFALTAAPAVAPPAGFSGRVVAAMTGVVAEDAPPRPTPARRASRRAVLLAAAAGLAVGIGGTVLATSLGGRSPGPGAPVAAPLLTPDGRTVGSAGLALVDGRTYLALNVTSGRAGASYECLLVGHDGRRTSGGSWTLTEAYAGGTASGSWLVPLAGDRPASVELVTTSGTVWARSTF